MENDPWLVELLVEASLKLKKLRAWTVDLRGTAFDVVEVPAKIYYDTHRLIPPSYLTKAEPVTDATLRMEVFRALDPVTLKYRAEYLVYRWIKP